MIRPEVAHLFAAMVAAFPTWKPDPSTFEIYALALDDIPIERLRAALVQHIKRSRFAPTVAEIREADCDLQAVLGAHMSEISRRIATARDRIQLIQEGRPVLVADANGGTRAETVQELESAIALFESRLDALRAPDAGPLKLNRGGVQ
jgi:hypothetical protein